MWFTYSPNTCVLCSKKWVNWPLWKQLHQIDKEIKYIVEGGKSAFCCLLNMLLRLYPGIQILSFCFSNRDLQFGICEEIKLTTISEALSYCFFLICSFACISDSSMITGDWNKCVHVRVPVFSLLLKAMFSTFSFPVGVVLTRLTLNMKTNPSNKGVAGEALCLANHSFGFTRFLKFVLWNGGTTSIRGITNLCAKSKCIENEFSCSLKSLSRLYQSLILMSASATAAT